MSIYLVCLLHPGIKPCPGAHTCMRVRLSMYQYVPLHRYKYIYSNSYNYVQNTPLPLAWILPWFFINDYLLVLSVGWLLLLTRRQHHELQLRLSLGVDVAPPTAATEKLPALLAAVCTAQS